MKLKEEQEDMEAQENKKMKLINGEAVFMKTYIIPRGKGKTTELIKKSAETGDYIVCHGLDEANRIQYEAQQMGLDIPLPITYAEFVEKRYQGRNISGFLIDNLEMFLQYLSNVPVNAITMCP